jgi:hypothetical protein
MPAELNIAWENDSRRWETNGIKRDNFLSTEVLYPGTGAQNRNCELVKQISEKAYERTWANIYIN